MKIVRTKPDLNAALDAERATGNDIAFVPTMGALHEGHLSLVRLARRHADVVIASIFVNPLQFGPTEDLDAYPRDEGRDLALLQAEGVDVVFLPAVEDMYPEGAATTIDVGPIGTLLEGADRPGHFNGVATVVAKLFNMVRPDVAVFGQKDAQQVAVIRQLIADLDFDIELVVGPIVRDRDGLALSSRNAYLGSEGKAQAVALHRALRAGEAAFWGGGEPSEVERVMGDVLNSSPGVEPAYAVAVDPSTFAEPKRTGPVLLLVAARVGTTRLIDNMLVE